MEIIHVFTNTYDIIYKNTQGAIHLPKAWKCWWLSWERNSLSGFTELKLSWLKRKLWFFFFLAFLAPREGGQAVGGCRQRLMAVGPGGHRGATERAAPCGAQGWGPTRGTVGPTASSPAANSCKERVLSSVISTCFGPPFQLSRCNGESGPRFAAFAG